MSRMIVPLCCPKGMVAGNLRCMSVDLGRGVVAQVAPGGELVESGEQLFTAGKVGGDLGADGFRVAFEPADTADGGGPIADQAPEKHGEEPSPDVHTPSLYT